MINKYYILLVLFISNTACFSQNNFFLNSQNDKIEIPFELSNNLIIIKIELNKVNLNMILDTGSGENLLFSVPNEEDLIVKNAVQTSIIGLGTKEAVSAIISTNNSLKINEYIDEDFRILILNESQIDLISKIGIEINGILGYSFFKDNIVAIDYIKNTVTIFKDKSSIKKRKLKKYTKSRFEIIEKKPFVSINSGIDKKDANLKLLIDTGLSDGLWLFENDSSKISSKNIDDYLGFGLSGAIKGKRARIENINLADFSFSDVLVAYPDSIFYNNIKIVKDRNGSIGGEVLKRFHIILDYKENEIYLKKNKFFSNDFNYNMSGLEVQHAGKDWVSEGIRLNSKNESLLSNTIILDNSATDYKIKYTLKPVFQIANIREKSPASFVDLQVGDKIISINNKNAYNFTIQKITELFQSEDDKKIKMEVERNGKIIKVIFYLKKII